MRSYYTLWYQRQIVLAVCKSLSNFSFFVAWVFLVDRIFQLLSRDGSTLIQEILTIANPFYFFFLYFFSLRDFFSR